MIVSVLVNETSGRGRRRKSWFALALALVQFVEASGKKRRKADGGLERII